MLQEWTEPNSFNICITSYKQFFKGFASFTRVRWKCLVVDEMQRVKGMTERHWEAVFTLQRSDSPCVCPVLSVADMKVLWRNYRELQFPQMAFQLQRLPLTSVPALEG